MQEKLRVLLFVGQNVVQPQSNLKFQCTKRVIPTASQVAQGLQTLSHRVDMNSQGISCSARVELIFKVAAHGLFQLVALLGAVVLNGLQKRDDMA